MEKKSNKIKLVGVRLSYPNLFKTQSFTQPDGTQTEPKYSAVFLLDKKTHADSIEEIQKAISKASFEFFKKKVKLKHQSLRDGEEKEDKDGYGEEVMFISASSKNRPQVVHRDPSIPLTDDDAVIFAGCYVNAVISFWAYDHKLGGKGVSCNLLAVQYTKDGEPFGERVDAEEEFEDESVDQDPMG